MPATSVAQQKFMAICEHNPKHAAGKCPDMSKNEMHDYAATPTKGLPYKAKAAPGVSLKSKMIGAK